MAVVAVHELWDGREGSKTTDGYTWKQEYTRVYEVITNTPADGPASVVDGAIAFGMPDFGAVHPEDAGAVATEFSPSQRTETPLMWTVRIRYTSDYAPKGQPENPLARDPVWKFTFQQRQEVAKTGRLVTAGVPAATATAITNSASEPFDPPAMLETSRPFVTVSVNRPAFDFTTAVTLQDAVNSAAWFGFAPRTCKIVGVDAENAFENGVDFWKIVYSFAIRWDTWDLKLLDVGFNERKYDAEVGGGKMMLQAITDTYGKGGIPYQLNGAGRPNPVGQPEVYRTYRVYREVNFSDLLV